MIFIIIILSILFLYLFLKNIELKNKVKFLKDTFQLKLLAKHVGLNREIEFLISINKNKDFSKLDEVIKRLENL